MKRILLFAVLGVMISGQAGAQKIELYADAAGSSCELVDEGAALHSVYVFYTGTAKAYGIRFAAPKPACWLGATWLGDTVGYTSIGDSQLDLSIAFGVCAEPPLYVARIDYSATGEALSCCEMAAKEPVPFPFVYADCNFAELPLTAGQSIVINPDESCRCQSPLAVEATTWGRVKSLYR